MDKVRLTGIKKIYNAGTENPVPALRGVDLTVAEGEMLAICGVSGSGKSTLLHIMGCLDSPGKGEYVLNGKRVDVNNSRTTAQLRNKEIGFILQQFGLLLERKVIDNVTVPLMFSGKRESGAKMKAKAMATMRDLNIANLAQKPCAQLSGGEKQRVAIARALVNDAGLILADEPTGSVDTKTRGIIMDVFRELTRKGKTVVIVTHDREVALACDRILTLEDGLIISEHSNSR